MLVITLRLKNPVYSELTFIIVVEKLMDGIENAPKLAIEVEDKVPMTDAINFNKVVEEFKSNLDFFIFSNLILS